MSLLQIKENLEIMIPAEVLAIEVFNKLTKRKKKDNTLAIKEIAYIYHMCNPSSPYYNYSEFDRQIKLTKDLFDGIVKDWKPDQLVEDAIVVYKDNIKTPSLHVVNTMLNSLHECNDIVAEITKQLKEDLKAGKHKTGINNKRGQIVSGVELMLNDLTSLLKVSKEIPSHIDGLEKLYEKLQSERSKVASKVKGGVYISERER